MRILYNQTSPFIRKIVVLAHETGQIDQIELVQDNPWAEDSKAAIHNPLGKVPVLFDGDEVIYDSKMIARYLLDLADNQQMLVPPSQRLLQMQLEAVADGMTEATVNRFLELNKRPPEKQMDYWLDRYQTSITRSLGWLEQRTDSFKVNFTLGALCVAVALSYLDLRYPELNWRDTHKMLANWHETAAQRKSMLATMPPTS